MPSQVNLQIFSGALSGQAFTYTEPMVCIIGRQADCQIQLPDDEAHKTISRYHCLLDISPPHARVRDFGSRNGTYINDLKIGQRPEGLSAEEGRKQSYPEHDLKDGDRIKIGETIFQVQIVNEEPQRSLQAIPNDQGDGQFDYSALVQNLFDRAKAGGDIEDVNLASLNDYRVVQPIAQGGFGAVYLAQQIRTGQSVALKLMLPQVAASDRKVRMFLREIDCLRALNHPHVVRFVEVGYSDDQFFLVMEYCNGGTIEDLVRKQGRPLTMAEALPLIDQILTGLAYSHQAPIPVQLPDGRQEVAKGVVHRDIRPSNFFLHQQDGILVAKLGDYGLAKCFEMSGLTQQTVTNSKTMGTPVLMSRSLLHNYRFAKPEVDIWATAASLYWMLTGYFPRDFNGDDPLQIVLREPTVPIGQRGVAIPAALAAVIDRALDESGDQLVFQDAIEFQQALRAAWKG